MQARRRVYAEGDLERNGSVCLVQLYEGGAAYIFDLHAALPSAKPSMIRQLDRLLGDANVVKVQPKEPLHAAARPVPWSLLMPS